MPRSSSFETGRSRPRRPKSSKGAKPNASIHEGLLSRVRVIRDALHPAERSVADTLLREPEQVVHLPIAELAELAGVSEGTVIRFCNSLGFRGYQALKLSLAADIARPTMVLHEEITTSDASDPVAVAQKVFGSNVSALHDTLQLLDPSALRQAIQAIEAASEIVFFAVGSSASVAVDATGRFLRIGLRARAEPDSHTQAVIASLLRSTAVAIAVSHSGQSREPIECLALARQRRATTIAVTARSPSPLTEHADIVLLTASSETRYREEALASRIAQLSLLDSLYVSIALRRPQASLDALRETSEALADHRM